MERQRIEAKDDQAHADSLACLAARKLAKLLPARFFAASREKLREIASRSKLNSLGDGVVVLFVADFFQPIDGLAVELLLDGDVRHGRGRRGAMPMLLARREPDHVAGTDFLDRAALALDPAAAGRDDQGLAQRVRVPGGPAPGLERDLAAAARAGSRLKQRIDAYSAGELIGRPFPEA